MENRKRYPIRTRILKIMLLITSISLTAMSFLGLLSMVSIRKEAEDALTEQAKDNLRDTIATKTSLADQRLGKYADIVTNFAYYAEDILNNPDRYERLDLQSADTFDTGDLIFQAGLSDEGKDWDSLKEQAERLANVAHRFYPVAEQNREIIKTSYFVLDNGLMISFDDLAEKVPPEITYYNFFETDWYKLGKSTDKAVFTDAYTDGYNADRGLTITCVAPIHDSSGNKVGVMALDIGITQLYDYIIDLDLGDDVTAVIIDDKGDLVSPDPSDEGAPKLMPSEKERMATEADGIVVRDKMYYAFSRVHSVDWNFCVRVPQSEVLKLANDIGNNIVTAMMLFAIIFLIIAFIVALVALAFSRKITYPIIKLTKDVKEISAGKLEHRAEISGNDEIGDLAVSFNDMAVSLKEHIGKLTAVTAEKERIATELSVAAQIQRDMMPTEFPICDKYSVYATMSPAKEVGGDFYDFFRIDSDRLCLIMADVSGKGVPAALFAVTAKTLLKVRTTTPGSPAQMLWDVNNSLCEDNPAGLFVTAWFGILTLSSGELIYVNAGHEYPAVKHSDGSFELIVSEHCPPLAAVEDIKYADETVKLSPGDRLFLYTDGIPEAKSEDGSRFGTDRMTEALNRYRDEPFTEILDKLKNDIDSFAGNTDQFDDITMMGLDWK